MIDAVIYVERFSELVAYLNEHAPETLARDENDNMAMPPDVVAFSRTPAIVNGDKLLAYCRFSGDQATQWRNTQGVEVLAEAPYQGRETSEVVYAALFNDAEATAKYDSVYDRTPKEFEDEDLGTFTVTPPNKFGVMA